MGGAAAGPCIGPFLSTTGRYLTFTCVSDDIVPGDANERSDTFIKDRNTGAAERVSVDSNEQERRFGSGGGFPSVDGRYVVFTSAAPLHPDLTFPYTGNGLNNPFLRDRLTGTTELLARNNTGHFAPQTGSAQLTGVSFPRTRVLFTTESNMIDGSAPPLSRPVQVYVRDWSTGAVTLVTRTPSGTFSMGNASGSTLSDDGRWVAFMTYASDLNSENPIGTEQLMLHDLTTGLTKRLSYTQNGGEFVGTAYYQGSGGRFSADGRLLVVEANSDELGPGDAVGFSDIYLVHTQTGRYELVSTGFNGARPDNASFWPSISADGRYVSFFSRASNLLPTPQAPAVYVKDRLTGEIVTVSAPLGAPRNFWVSRTDLSADGTTVAFDWRHPDADPTLGGRTLGGALASDGGARAESSQPTGRGTSRGFLHATVRRLRKSTLVRRDCLNMELSLPSFADPSCHSGRSMYSCYMQLNRKNRGRSPSQALLADAEALNAALADLVRVYQFRDRDRICCYDISVTQCYALEALADHGPMRSQTLAGLLLLDKSTTTRVIDALERKGYVERRTDEEDARAVSLQITGNGRSLYDTINRGLIAQQAELLADLDPQVRASVTDVIRRLAKAAEARFVSGVSVGTCAPACGTGTGD